MKVNIDSLKACAVEILVACGEAHNNALHVAENMVRADARGVTTHGTYLLTPIYNRVQVKQLELPTMVKIVNDDSATAVVDGNDGLGAVAGQLAVEIAKKKARQYGISIVLIRNTNNIGSLAYYTEQLAKEGMIAMMSCNAAPAMAPWGGAEPFMGTNPISSSIYTGEDNVFSADMATSVVARGKIRKAARNGQSIPDDWAMDETGKPTTDPNEALKGTLMPMGGPKGSAIALAVDIISGILAGAGHAPNLKSFHVTEGPTGVGASLIAVDIQHFMDRKDFSAIMGHYKESVKSMKKANDMLEIMMPGELEYRKEQASMENGIDLDENAATALRSLLQKIGSDMQLDIQSS
ncbi:MAG: Ldh family oxidoreductase [Eubacteriales bacterium]|nr:Ldh family oxidoreductase [Eubacteriales bacterium]